MKNIDLVVFDMAGTTVDEDNVVYKTLQKAINKKGLDVSLDFVLLHGAGKEKHQAIKDVMAASNFAAKNQLSTDEIFEDFKIMLDKAYEHLNVKPCPGVAELLPLLKSAGIKIALNTGYNEKVAKHLLGKLEWTQGKEYDLLVTASDVENGRPNPDMIILAMKTLDIMNPIHVLKAGDSIIDITEGKNANCGITVGVTTGAQTRSQLASAQPTYVVDSLMELAELII